LVKGHKNILDNFGVFFYDIALLQELGILHTGDFTSYNFSATTNATRTPLLYGDTVIIMDRAENSPKQTISIILFTNIGKELLKLVTIVPDFKYCQYIAKELKSDTTKMMYGKVISIQDMYIEHTNPLIEIPEINN
jgi:hypothetical protein